MLCLLSSQFAACGTSSNMSKYTQAQITALTTRTVDASYDDTFRAATDALFDGGYTVSQSDHAGGTVSGYKRDDKSAERFWINPYIQDTDFRMSVLVRDRSPVETSVRISMAVNGEPYINEEAVDNFWQLMRRQVLIQAPPPVDGAE
jgi:hypothetical protein